MQRMEHRIDSFIAAACNAERERELNRLFLAYVRELGYQAFDAYRHRVADTLAMDDPGNFVVASYDPGILGPYLSKGMAEMCPVLTRLSEAMTPFDYIAFLERQPESSSIQWQRKTLKAFLVRHAWCIPLNTVSQVKGVTVYMAGGTDRLVEFQSTRHEASLIAAYYMEALESFRPGPSATQPTENRDPDIGADLSAREIDCLHWAAQGHSNPEIADALSVSANTVRFHMKNAFRKLGATSRVTAVSKAQEIGLIG